MEACPWPSRKVICLVSTSQLPGYARACPRSQVPSTLPSHRMNKFDREVAGTWPNQSQPTRCSHRSPWVHFQAWGHDARYFASAGSLELEQSVRRWILLLALRSVAPCICYRRCYHREDTLGRSRFWVRFGRRSPSSLQTDDQPRKECPSHSWCSAPTSSAKVSPYWCASWRTFFPFCD